MCFEFFKYEQTNIFKAMRFALSVVSGLSLVVAHMMATGGLYGH
jgi:hypothetical protein